MNTAYVTLGSNLGDRRTMLAQALERISFSNKILKISDVYETFSAHEDRDPYLNCAIEIQTDMASSQLMQFLLEIQKQLGGSEERMTRTHCSVDLDLISHENEVVRTPHLTLPHPEAHRRAYVMVPLAQINPHWKHPVLNETAQELAQKAF